MRAYKSYLRQSALALPYLFFTACNTTYSAVYVLPTQGNIIGQTEYTSSENGDTLAEVGARFGMGYSEMRKANPSLEPVQILAEGTRVLIPSQFLLPKTLHRGIVIDLSAYRLFYFPADENVVFTYPVGIGREGWDTPIGQTTVVSKQAHPDWYPTKKIRSTAAKNGFPLPKYFPAGPDNPLGNYVLRLGWPSYLIHGTNRSDGMGTRVSAGCIRMQANDIEELFSLVEPGTPVQIIAKIS